MSKAGGPLVYDPVTREFKPRASNFMVEPPSRAQETRTPECPPSRPPAPADASTTLWFYIWVGILIGSWLMLVLMALK